MEPDRRVETHPVDMSKSVASNAPAGYRFPLEVTAVAVRWYLRYRLSYRDVEELLTERGISVDHVTTLLCLSFLKDRWPARARGGSRPPALR